MKKFTPFLFLYLTSYLLTGQSFTDTIAECIIENFKIQGLDFNKEMLALDEELKKLNLGDGSTAGQWLLLSQIDDLQREKMESVKLDEDVMNLGARTTQYCIDNEYYRSKDRRQWPFDLMTELKELRESSVPVKNPYEYKKMRAEIIASYTEPKQGGPDQSLKSIIVQQELYNLTYRKFIYDPRSRAYQWRKEKGHTVRQILESKYFGDYTVPSSLEKLRLLEEHHIASWTSLGFGISYDHHYSVTPLDVIPFIGTGSNGIHYGFLTDFDPNLDLNDAYIVCVAPTYDPPVNIVAKNLDEFLSLLSSTYESTVMADRYSNEAELEEAIQYAKDSIFLDLDGFKHREKNRSLLEKEFGAKPVNNVYQVIESTRKQRASQISSETLDGMGIRFKKDEPIQEFVYSREPKDVSKFLDSVNLNSRLKFYRNASLNFILSAGYDEEIKNIIIEYLKKDGLMREAGILEDY